MKKLFILSSIAFSMTFHNKISFASEALAQNAYAECDSVTGIFLYENLQNGRILNTYIRIEDIPEPLNYTDLISDYLESNAPNSDIQIGCLETSDGVALKYRNEEDKSIIIQIDNDGRVQSYEETSAFAIRVVQTLKIS